MVSKHGPHPQVRDKRYTKQRFSFRLSRNILSFSRKKSIDFFLKKAAAEPSAAAAGNCFS
jgi:hypothetical protein